MIGSAEATQDRGKPSLLSGWIGQLHEFDARAIVVLGPHPDFDPQRWNRTLIAVHPQEYAPEAALLARSDVFGPDWRANGGSLAAWRNLTDMPGCQESWIGAWLEAQVMALVRVEIPMPFQNFFEIYVLTGRHLTSKPEAASIAWTALNAWPQVKSELVQQHLKVSAREREVLILLAGGLTSKDAALKAGCTERTIGFHLGNLMTKLKAENRAEVVQRACALGIL